MRFPNKAAMLDRAEEIGEKIGEGAKTGTFQICCAIMLAAIILAIGIMVAGSMMPR